MKLRLIPAMVLLLTVTACGATPAASAAGEPRSGGDLVWAVETEPLTFNPHQYAQAKARLLVWNSFESLFTHDAQGNYVAWLATGIEGGGLTYTIRLRTDVTFHDGGGSTRPRSRRTSTSCSPRATTRRSRPCS
ncbi:hypothetical protein [Catenuloplanes indicus]|uniref:ABC-type transport system substrate-binding protein n=1 Tax=Catenuloplanes indicus TaxID=137267 RepID=A0AAE4AXK7_9ACTN|nr:hypothetical protein [Catenuloplanes indicus]MDQ0364158.1 ABC-type transport system substrate-binding protein [Catenuloplanes indicus]